LEGRQMQQTQEQKLQLLQQAEHLHLRNQA
jgi:hypothetical protein